MARPDPSDRDAPDTPVTIVAWGATVAWLVISALVFFGMAGGAAGLDPLRVMMVPVAIFGPVALIWIAAFLTRRISALTRAVARLEAGSEGGDLARRLDALAAGQKALRTSLSGAGSFAPPATEASAPDAPPGTKSPDPALPRERAGPSRDTAPAAAPARDLKAEGRPDDRAGPERAAKPSSDTGSRPESKPGPDRAAAPDPAPETSRASANRSADSTSGVGPDREAASSAAASPTSPRPSPSAPSSPSKAAPPPAAKPSPDAPAKAAVGEAAPDLDLPQAEIAEPPLSAGTLIHALQFPADAEDREGFRALRHALKDRRAKPVVTAAQDMLTLLSELGLYMDDLPPASAPAETWRRFARGERGASVAGIAGPWEADTQAQIAEKLRQDTVFRDTAHHFVRMFDRLLADRAQDMSDEEIRALAGTRSARAFSLIGRALGTFD